MATQPTKAGEEDLSMEEILHSIRKIIAEDGDEPIPAADAPEPAASGSDVLELTELVEEPVAAAPAPAPASDVLSTIDEALAEPIAPIAPAPKPAVTEAKAPEVPPAISANDQAYIDSLLSKEAANATSSAFKKIQPLESPLNTTPSHSFRSGTTVEDLVLESLRPMLKSWLDANLPNIVERIVEREVRKISHSI